MSILAGVLFFGHINFESVMWCKSVRGAAMAPGRFDAAFTSTQLQPNLRLYNLYQFEPTLLPQIILILLSDTKVVFAQFEWIFAH